ncbi:concanavalin A-like lectin/glucanase [Basidiobolus meristosporus CBS 931.73]|uniref:Concanavalin A-like lectin/glucanase n=1 Tax=Basidiobolus meristosporus CBS 931.73 TaxID=1314790 RepID=A0A1Y1ZA93_9FUNG|nr:concanavalin A-like lectin/glucanase [Basidiobolus meristosporus CBS 931.73]|eukprot:ORY07190.1 concanavalin A-like lectin/glucanase [Basidiobolus meristosporus CBS 931.73]
MCILNNRLFRASTIAFIAVGLLCLVIITPIVQHYKDHHHGNDHNEAASGALKQHGIINTSANKSSTAKTTSHSHTSTTSSASPSPTLSKWVDPDTPQQFRTKMAGGQNFTLVFSDEFNTPGRKFAEGEDPKWTAVDLWYWSTGNMEWLSPDAVTTFDGSMKIQMTKQEINGHQYRSGMVQSWNKFCFTGGIIEVNVSLPGRGDIPGFWPAVWTMGNLGRAGYGATTDGTWPYTYDTCDSAVGVNQSLPYPLSRQPGQRLNKCVCPGEDHPNPGTGRGAPEIDVFEAAGVLNKNGVVSLSDQIAPFDYKYKANEEFMYLYGKETTHNGYLGGICQQCVSAVNPVPADAYEGKAFQTYSFEYVPGPDGYIIWRINGQDIWRLDAAAIGPDARSEVAQRLISAEPMYIIMNFGMSHSWGWFELDKVPFPSTMWIDYIRVYQRPDKISVTCDPPGYPTTQYIKDHINAYNDTSLRFWKDAVYEFPKYNLDGHCPDVK